MKRNMTLVALATLWLIWPHANAQAAAPADELAEIRRALDALTRRVERLEQENAALRAQNETLQRQGESLQAEARELRETSARQAAALESAADSEWTRRIEWHGDLHWRHEQIDDDLTNDGAMHDTRHRERIRARVGLEAQVTETLTAGVQLATGGADPRSANQTLGDAGSRKDIGLDLAYLRWQFADWGNVTAGKMKLPIERPGQSRFYDNDFNPEGIAFGFERGIWFARAYNFWMEERSTAADTLLWGTQVGVRLPIRESSLMLAVHYSDLAKGQGALPFFDCSSLTVAAQSLPCTNGNTVVFAAPGDPVLAYDFDVIELAAEWSGRLGAWPLEVWANLAENQDPEDLTLAWAVGIDLGKAGKSRTWEAGVGYQSIEKDALFGAWVDSNFAAGRTDGTGWFFRGGYAPLENWTLNATYFLNERNVDVGTTGDHRRLQLDVNLKF